MRRGILGVAALLLLIATEAGAQTMSAVLDSVQRTAFQYFWNEANPANGLIRDRSTSGSPASIAATGFGLSAITVGIDHGWITRDQGRDRVRTTLNTFWTYPQNNLNNNSEIGYKGLFYHFLDMNTGLRTWSSELSTIDTGLLFGGIAHVREYFTGTDSLESSVRALADSILRRADWKFMQNLQSGIKMGWLPDGTGFSHFGTWVGYNEASIMYLLALGSPTHAPTVGNCWTTWTSGYSLQTQYGYTYVVFPPLFGHQYSHCWIDYRNINDGKMASYNANNPGLNLNYFENSRRATLAARAYCAANPGHFAGYSDSLWGLTASDDPNGYVAHGAPPAQSDNGTISPTAATSSIAFASAECIPAIRNMYTHYPQLWGKYGFRDAFNLSTTPAPWYDTDWLGIDQGPIVLMIENYLNGSVWARFMHSPYIQTGLSVAGFTRTATAVPDPPEIADARVLLPNEPNPFRDATTIRFRLAEPGRVRLTVYDVAGRSVARLVDGARPAGLQSVTLTRGALKDGVYYYRLETARGAQVRRCVLLQ